MCRGALSVAEFGGAYFDAEVLGHTIGEIVTDSAELYVPEGVGGRCGLNTNVGAVRTDEPLPDDDHAVFLSFEYALDALEEFFEYEGLFR